MGIVLGRVAAIKPVSVHAYFDKIAFWVTKPLDISTKTKLRQHCGHVHIGNRRARFNRKFIQRIELKQPSESSLRAVAGLPSAYINQAEAALDLVFKSTRERDQGYEFLDYHLVRRWHGKRQQIRVVAGKAETRYDAGRYAANSIITYKENHSRVTGELDCIHIEWRAARRKAVRSIGITLARDAVRFDFHQFWQNRLLLFAAEPERIGRYLRNRRDGSRSRAADRDDKKQGWGGEKQRGYGPGNHRSVRPLASHSTRAQADQR